MSWCCNGAKLALIVPLPQDFAPQANTHQCPMCHQRIQTASLGLPNASPHTPNFPVQNFDVVEQPNVLTNTNVDRVTPSISFGNFPQHPTDTEASSEQWGGRLVVSRSPQQFQFIPSAASHSISGNTQGFQSFVNPLVARNGPPQQFQPLASTALSPQIVSGDPRRIPAGGNQQMYRSLRNGISQTSESSQRLPSLQQQQLRNGNDPRYRGYKSLPLANGPVEPKTRVTFPGAQSAMPVPVNYRQNGCNPQEQCQLPQATQVPSEVHAGASSLPAAEDNEKIVLETREDEIVEEMQDEMRVIVPRNTINPDETAIINIPEHLLNRPVLRVIRTQRNALNVASANEQSGGSFPGYMSNYQDTTSLGLLSSGFMEGNDGSGLLQNSTGYSMPRNPPAATSTPQDHDYNSLGLLRSDQLAQAMSAGTMTDYMQQTQEASSLGILSESFMEQSTVDSGGSPGRRITETTSRTYIINPASTPQRGRAPSAPRSGGDSSLGILRSSQLNEGLSAGNSGYLDRSSLSSGRAASPRRVTTRTSRTYVTSPDVRRSRPTTSFTPRSGGDSSLGILPPSQLNQALNADSISANFTPSQIETSDSMGFLDEGYLNTSSPGSLGIMEPALMNSTLGSNASGYDSQVAAFLSNLEALEYNSIMEL